MTNTDDILSADELDTVSGGQGINSRQPTPGRRKDTASGNSPGDGTINTASGIVIEFEDDDGSNAPADSSREQTPQPIDASQSEGTIESRSGIAMELEDDAGDGPSAHESSQQKTDSADSSVRTRSGVQINLEDEA